MDSDLHLGQIAIRMGCIQPHQLPGLLREARVGHVEESAGRASSLGQALLRRKLISVSDYLYMARQVRVEREQAAPPPSDQGFVDLASLQQAFTRFESGELDHSSFEDMLGKSAESAPLERPAELTRFGDYELLGEVARGGMGIVYRAKTTKGNVVALKVMIEADDDEVRLKRFEHEAELAAALDHPHIVSIHDAGRIDGIPYFTMDLIEGKTLDDVLEGEGIDRDAAFKAIAEVAEAIDHAHERGIVHRDLKPGNIILDKVDGSAHVTDFGLARDLARMTRLTQVGQAVGTPYYMAPEQVRGERDVDGRADIYALGVILYEVLTGDVPFDADSPLSLFKKIDQDPVVLELDPELGIDEHLHKIVMRALAKDRDERYARGRLLAEDLERYLRGVPPKARAYDWREDLTDRLRRNRLALLAAVLGVLALVTVAVAGTMAWHRYQAGQALAAGRAAVEDAVDAMRSLAALAEADLDAGRPLDAVEKARRGLERLADVEALLAAGGPQAEGGQQALGDDPQEPARLHLALARGLSRLARSDPALHGQQAQEALRAASQSAPLELEVPLLLAELLAASGDLQAAVEALGAALAIDGQSAAALTRRGRLYLELGRPEDALRDLADALLADPRSLEARLARAHTYVALGRLEAAQEDATAARALEPERPEPYLSLGDVARARGDPAAADAAYRRAAGVARHDPRPYMSLGALKLERGSYEGALLAFKEAEQADGGALALIGQARAMAFLLRLEEARITCEAALAGAPEGDLGARAAALTLRGVVALAGGLGDAEADFREAAATDPRAGAPRVWLARLALWAGAAPEVALAQLEGVADDPDSLAVRARAALAGGDPDAARDLAERAVAQAAGRPHARARAALAEARAAAESGSRAVQAACDAAWAESCDEGELAASYLQRGEELLGLGLAYREPKLRERAALLLEASRRLDPQRARAHAALAELRLAERRSDDAWEASLRATVGAPFRPELSERLAAAALQTPTPERLEQALEALARGIEAGGATPTRWLLRARCLAQLGRWSVARQELEDALRGGPAPELEEAYAGVLERLGLPADAEHARARARRLEGEVQELAARLEGWSQAGAAPLAELRATLLEARARGDLQHDLRLRTAAFAAASLLEDPLQLLESLCVLLQGPGTDGLDEADRHLTPRWTPLTPSARAGLLRAAGSQAPARTLAVGVAAMFDGLRGAGPAAGDAEALDHAQQAVSSRPASLTAWAARAYLRLHLGEADRALRELDAAAAVAPRSGLLQLIRAEALAALDETRASDEALEQARSAGVQDLDARVSASPLLR